MIRISIVYSTECAFNDSYSFLPPLHLLLLLLLLHLILQITYVNLCS